LGSAQTRDYATCHCSSKSRRTFMSMASAASLAEAQHVDQE
jgi:hypothetical protein